MNTGSHCCKSNKHKCKLKNMFKSTISRPTLKEYTVWSTIRGPTTI